MKLILAFLFGLGARVVRILQKVSRRGGQKADKRMALRKSLLNRKS